MSVQAIDIPYLIPDMPSSEEVLPFLQEIDQNRWYTNGGPLLNRLNEQLNLLHFAGEEVCTVLCSTGTAAIELGLMCLNLPKNARVLVPAFTFPATANAIENCGFEPVFCDVDEASWVLTPKIALEAIAQSHVDAVMPVAALGRPLSASLWDEFHEATGLPVIIDAAPALGNQRVGRHLLVAYSMHATKAFGVGEGGLLASRNEEIIAKAKKIINFGMEYGQVVMQGANYKLSEYHAAVGLAQIKRWPERQLKRARVQTAYQSTMRQGADLWSTQSFIDRDADNRVLVPLQVSNSRSTMSVCLHGWRHPDLAQIQALLAGKGIGTRLWYNPGLHCHPRWQSRQRVCRAGESTLVTVDSLNRNLIGLPFHTFLTPENVFHIVASLRQVIENRERSALLS